MSIVRSGMSFRIWTAERWIRVTDDDGLAQFIQLNGVGLDQYGHPALVNAVGSLDVDIILDEGPDTLTMAQDVFQTLQQIIPPLAPLLSPAEAQAALGILIESSPLTSSAKTKFKKAAEAPPDPMQMQSKQVALQSEVAKTEKTKADTAKSYAQAMGTLHDAHVDAQTALASGQPGAALMASQPTESASAPVPPGGAGALGPVPGAVQVPEGGDVPSMPVQPQPQPLPAPTASAAPPQPMLPAASPQPPVMIHFDANREAMGPMMHGVVQNSQAIVAALQSRLRPRSRWIWPRSRWVPWRRAFTSYRTRRTRRRE